MSIHLEDESIQHLHSIGIPNSNTDIFVLRKLKAVDIFIVRPGTVRCTRIPSVPIHRVLSHAAPQGPPRARTILDRNMNLQVSDGRSGLTG